ncbi:MAG: alginate lyase family protein [Lachnospiraceae bacterium]|nr:alginate lyase family protein [Lachnospiraceae bacterium]
MNKLISFLCAAGASSILCACTMVSAEEKLVMEPLQKTILERTAKDLESQPATVTCFIAERSAGTKHDFYSEGDYWWPDSLNPDGPYIRRDGETNPDNFVEHRHAMIRFSRIVGNLTSAYLLTGDRQYLDPAIKHIRAWFIDEETRMNPHLLYAQAIKGIATGRGIGIIDTVHLIEVAQSLMKLEEKGAISQKDLAGAKEWFRQYLSWMKTHPYGVNEMNATNNHGTCWAMQAAMFAKLIGDKETMKFCADRFKNVFIPNQMAADGSFPQELARTKPYGYSLFNLDAMATLCQILSNEDDNLWEYTTPDGRNMKKAVEFMMPYIADKGKWEYGKDVMYWDEWPVAHPALLFAWMNYGDERYYANWAKYEHFPENEEVIRNLPIRNPIIWL